MDTPAIIFAAVLMLGQTTQPVYVLPEAPASWERLITAIAMLLTAAGTLWALLKSQKAETKAEDAMSNASENRESIRRVGDREHKRALATPVPVAEKPQPDESGGPERMSRPPFRTPIPPGQ